jgi:hypothetical protein
VWPHFVPDCDLFMGNFFMLWGEAILGAKKEREKKEESSCLMSLRQCFHKDAKYLHHSSLIGVI